MFAPINTFAARGFNRVPQAAGILPRYLATRAHYRNAPACDVLAALRDADAAARLRIKPRDWPPCNPYNPRISRRVGYSQREVLSTERWIENTSRAGLRFVGYADELAGARGWFRGIDHAGWYLDGEFPDSSETYRGAVWQLPARGGCAVYVGGYSDPFNDGAALIDFEPIHGERVDYYDDDGDAKREAAHAADSIAARDAETEREYRYRWNAAQRVRDLREDIAAERERHSLLVAGLRESRRVHAAKGIEPPALLCAELFDRLESIRERVRDLAREIRETVDTYGDEILTDEYA